MEDRTEFKEDAVPKDADPTETDDGEEIFASSLPLPIPVHKHESDYHSKRSFKIAIGATLLLMLVLGIVLGVTLPNKGSTQNKRSKQVDNREHLTASPTPAPTPASREGHIIRYLIEQGVSSEDSLSVKKSGQYQAVAWMAHKDKLNLPVPKVDFGMKVVNEAYHFVARYVLALLWFHNKSSSGTSWLEQAGFATSAHHCGWNGQNFLGQVGVFCETTVDDMNITMRVPTRLQLDFNGLAGNIPSELANLWTLEVIDLEGNQITGGIPTQLASLPYLRSLILDRNSLSGKIPQKLGSNGNLRTLFLSNNKLTGSVPASLKDSKSLSILAMDDNSIQGNIHFLNAFENLTTVFLEDNAFTGTISDSFLNNHPRLQKIDLSDNSIEGTIPAHFLKSKTLEVLDLHGNLLHGSLPQVPNRNTKLSFLALHNNTLNGTIPDLSSLAGLRHLDLSENSFSGDMPTEIGSLKELTYLFLSDNPFTAGPIPPEYGNLYNLRELSLKKTHRHGEIADFFANLKELVLLDLDANNLKGQIPDFLGNLTSLYGLLLNRNLLTGPVPASFGNLTDLRLLFLDRNQVNGTLEPLCELDQFRNKTGAFPVIADCQEVACSCCTECCTDGKSCHNNDFVPSRDPIWETDFNHNEYVFGNGTILP